MTLTEAVAAQETWMRAHIAVVEADLAFKHEAMKASPFAFLRATCFRFAARLPLLCPAMMAATPVPSVGDAHLENFGTWRDAEGRLVWGVNDLDEAALLPWMADLLRLATSALLARGPDAPTAKDIAAAVLDGYAERVQAPSPFVLDTQNAALRDVANPTPEDRTRFWKKLAALTPAEPPKDYAKALQAALPLPFADLRLAPRRAGLGSLGRPRWVATAEWCGGRVAREVKARLPSAWLQAGFPGARPVDVAVLSTAPERAPDPWFRMTETMVLRRLAPDSRKIEARPEALLTLLRAMGGEIGNLHSTGEAKRVAQELAALPAAWLRDGAKALAADVVADHAAWAA